MLKGGCLCGGVSYAYDGEITEVAMCHCGQCRRAQGTGFVTNSPVDAAKLHLLSGAELLHEYRATPLKARVFCSRCGSPLWSLRDDLPGVRRLRLGTLETPFSCDKRYHIHVASKAAWVRIDDGYPQFEAMNRV